MTGDSHRHLKCIHLFFVIIVNFVLYYLQHMETQEKDHVESFEKLVVQRRVRPSLFLPLFECAGFALGEYSVHEAYVPVITIMNMLQCITNALIMKKGI